ncbi:unnamed protein product [Schistosoma haematobium]|nr:unnamed protein product [Schistosoma haematobium]
MKQMKDCFMQAIVIFIYYLDVYFKLKVYTESIKHLQQQKIQTEEQLAYELQDDVKAFHEEVMRLEKLYGAKWILDLFKNINPNDANSLQTYSENYERLSDIKSNPDLDEYSHKLLESAIEKKWNARLNFDLATNTYLNMKPSSKSSSLTENNRKSLDERKSTLQQIEKQYKESKLRVKNTFKEVIETGLAFRNVCDAVKKDLPKLNPQLKEMQKNISEMTELFEDYSWDLKSTEAEAKKTLDSNQRHNLERKVEDLRQIVKDYKERMKESKNNLDDALNKLLFANPDVKAEEDKNRDATIRYFDASYNHLKTLTNMEIQRIDVLELLSLEERMQIYESIMQEEINSV